VTIVIGFDRHRARIAAGWIDAEAGAVGRSRVRGAGRAGVRGFRGRFAGRRLEVALGATTGRRLVVEERRAIGAVVGVAEPVETAAGRGKTGAPRPIGPTPGICASR
jgi:hypothetical protein